MLRVFLQKSLYDIDDNHILICCPFCLDRNIVSKDRDIDEVLECRFKVNHLKKDIKLIIVNCWYCDHERHLVLYVYDKYDNVIEMSTFDIRLGLYI